MVSALGPIPIVTPTTFRAALGTHAQALALRAHTWRVNRGLRNRSADTLDAFVQAVALVHTVAAVGLILPSPSFTDFLTLGTPWELRELAQTWGSAGQPAILREFSTLCTYVDKSPRGSDIRVQFEVRTNHAKTHAWYQWTIAFAPAPQPHLVCEAFHA